MANGFSYSSSHEWANLGQGAPEVGPIPDAPPRPDSIPVPVYSLEYAPTTGIKGESITLIGRLQIYQVHCQPFVKPLQTSTMLPTAKTRQASTLMRMFA